MAAIEAIDEVSIGTELLATPSVVLGPAASASPTSSLEPQNLRTPGRARQFPRVCAHAFRCEKCPSGGVKAGHFQEIPGQP